VGLVSGCVVRVTQSPPDWSTWGRSDRAPGLNPGTAWSRPGGCIRVQVARGRPAAMPVQAKLPGRKFQSHPGVPPARLIVSKHEQNSNTYSFGLWHVPLEHISTSIMIAFVKIPYVPSASRN
jgi:hypothetical protein